MFKFGDYIRVVNYRDSVDGAKGFVLGTDADRELGYYEVLLPTDPENLHDLYLFMEDELELIDA